MNIRELEQSDIKSVAEFQLAETIRQGVDPTSALEGADRLTWLLFDNPFAAPEVPRGWVLRDNQNAILGVMFCIPWQFDVPGAGAVTALMSSGFYVRPDARGAGLAIFKKYLNQASRYLLFCTTANELTATLWKQFGARPIPGSNQELLWIVTKHGLAEEVVYRKTRSQVLGRAAGFAARCVPSSRLSGGAASALKRLGPAEAAQMPAPASQTCVTTHRTGGYLSWRHFGNHANGVELFEITVDATHYVLAVHLDHRGYRHQIRTLSLRDVSTPPTAQHAAKIAGALAQYYVGRLDAISYKGAITTSGPQTEDHGARVRTLPIHTGWFFDRLGVLRDTTWHLVMADHE